MAKGSGRIEKDDLIAPDAVSAFSSLQIAVEENIRTIEKLRQANVKLNNERSKASGESPAMRTAYNLRQKYLAQQRTINALVKGGTVDQNKYNASIRGGAKATTIATAATGRLSKAMAVLRSIVSSVAAPLAILYAIWRGIGKIKDTVIQLDSFRFALNKITGSTARTTETMRYLIGITDKFGINLGVATDRYVKFSASAIQAGLSLDDTRQIFSAMSKASGVLGLKAHEVEGVFLALEQMLSKGKVTTEELRRQLGERLPGAFGIMAATVNKLNPDIEVTVATLDKMLKSGLVLSHEVLPEFAKMYNEAFGIDKVERVETLAGAQARFANSWTVFVFELENGAGVLSKTFTGFFDFMTLGFDGLADKMTLIGSSSIAWYTKLQIMTTGLFGQSEKELADIIRNSQILLDASNEMNTIIKGMYNDFQKTPETFALAQQRFENLNAIMADTNLKQEEKTRIILTLNDAMRRGNKEALISGAVAEKTINWYDTQIQEMQKKLKQTVSLTEANGAETQSIVTKIGQFQEERRQLAELLKLNKAKIDAKKDNKAEIKLAQEALEVGRQRLLNEKSLLEARTNQEGGDLFERLDLETELEEKSIDISRNSHAQKLLGLKEGSDAYKSQLLKQKREEDAIEKRYSSNRKSIKEGEIQFEEEKTKAALNVIKKGFNDRAVLLAKDVTDGTKTNEEYQEELLKLEKERTKALAVELLKRLRLEVAYAGISAKDKERKLAQISDLEANISKIDPKKDSEEKDPEATTEDYLEAVSALIGGINDLGQALFDAQIQRIDEEISATEEKYSRLYELASGDAELTRQLKAQEKKDLEKLEKEKVKLKIKAAKFDKVAAISQAGINTALGITKVLGQPWLIALIAALGAVQIASIIATPIPKYAKGTDNAKGGLSIVGDGGREEVVVGKDGTYLTPNVSTLAYLNKGDKVYKSKDDYKNFVMDSVTSQANTHFELDEIEKAIERGFKNATVNNYLKLPKQKQENINFQLWANQQTQW